MGCDDGTRLSAKLATPDDYPVVLMIHSPGHPGRKEPEVGILRYHCRRFVAELCSRFPVVLYDRIIYALKDFAIFSANTILHVSNVGSPQNVSKGHNYGERQWGDHRHGRANLQYRAGAILATTVVLDIRTACIKDNKP
jgi:hypothetical protein